MLNTSQTAQNIVKSANGSAVAINELTKSSKLAEIGIKALAMAGNMLIAWGVSKAIELVVKAFDNYIHRVENANEATKQAIETFESVTSEVESLENKITEINQEINGLDPITDAQDIENLRLENEELSIQLAILKEKQRVAGLEADKTAQDSLNTKQDSKYKFDTFTDSMGGVTVVASQVTKEEELLNAIEAYDTYKAKIDEANKALTNMAQTGNYTQKEWDAQEKAIEKYSEGMLNARSHANELAIELNEQIQGLNGNTVASQALIDSVNASIAGYNEWIGSIDGATDALNEQANIQGEIADEPPISFNIAEHEKSIDDIQSSLTTLRSALDSFNQGTLDESAILDLMQQFPALIPYIDLAADGFGNLSEGLSVLIAQQPDALIRDLEQLKLSLNTDEERAQVDLLINSLQRLSSYGDTGMEAYATSIGSTWSDTANVIDSVTTQFENLAKIQEAVSDGLTMSATAAAELARMYPEILTNCEIAANGQITLNEDVVKNILAGDQSIVDAQITKLEADKAVLEAKQKTAESELEIAKQVGTAKGQITEEEARNQIEALEAELQAELEKNRQTVESYAVATESKMQNASQFNTHAATVASDIATNMLSAAVSMANNMKVNSENSQQSLSGIGHKAAEVAKSIAAIATGQVVDTSDKIHGGKGGTNASPIKIVNNTKGSSSVTRNYLDGNIDLGEFQSQLELDIKGYTDAIANIDGQIAVLKNLQATFEDTVNSANGGIGGHNYADKIKQLEDEKDNINDALNDAKSGSGSSTKEAEDNFEEMIDFFERRTDVLNNALTLLKTNLDNVTGAFAKNQLIDAELGITEEKFKNTADALNMYTQKANEALSKIPSDIASKVKDGAVDLTTFIGEGNEDVVEAIKDYETWADKVANCKQELAELKTTIRQLELEKFNNVLEDFNNQFDLREDSKSLISKQIALLEEAGELIGESFFAAQIDQSKKQLAILEEEKSQLVKQMESAINFGRVEKGTDEWLEMANALADVEGNILECKKSIEEFDNELLNLNWQIFERVQTEFSNISSELDNLTGLFDDFNDIRVSDGKGTWTREAIATLGLYAQQYELAKYQVEQYSEAIDKLKQDYLEGKYSATEYMDKLADLSKGQWDAVNSAESLEDAIYKLNESRINEEIESIEDQIDAYKKLTDEMVKNLEEQEDLYQHKKKLSEMNKTVADLERQLAAMQNDNSASTIARRKKLEEELVKSKQDLADYEYQHSIDSQKDALNKEYENFENLRNKEIEDLRLSLENREQLIYSSFENVKANADIIGQEIANIAIQHGVTVSDAIITSWQNGENAIASYGNVLNAGTSAFISNLMGVEYKVYDLQNQANATANTLAWMFGTRADTLVNELTTSYYSEQNLANMTNALQQSLVNALERGYNISSITNALGSIESAAKSAKAAIDTLNNTPVNTSPVSDNGSGGNGNSSSSGSGSGTSGNNIRYSGGYDERFGSSSSNRTRYKLMPDGRKVLIAYAKGGIVTKDDDNPLNHIAEAVGEDTIIAAKEGEGVLTAEQTDALLKMAPILKEAEQALLMKNNIVPVDKSLYMPGIVPPNNVNHNNGVNLNYDSLITINGNVNDTRQFLKDIEGVAQNAINKSFERLNMERRYG